MLSIATSSSSAAICTKAVNTPWPISTLPVEIVTSPADRKATHWLRRGLSTQPPGIATAVTCALPRADGLLPSRRRAECDCAFRTGRCCRQAHWRSRRETVTDCDRAALSQRSECRQDSIRTGLLARRGTLAAAG